MIQGDGTSDESTRVRKSTLILFVCFNSALLLASAFLADPTIFFVTATLLAILSSFILRVKNFLEIFLLVVFVFCIDLAYKDFGLFALLGGGILLFSLTILRSLAEGGSNWKYMVFTKELLLFIGIAFLSLFWGNPAFTGYRLWGINFVLGFLLFLIAHFSVSSFKSLHFLSLLLILVITMNAAYAILFHMNYGHRAISFFVETPTYSGHYFVQAIALSVGAYFSPPFRSMRAALLLAMIILLIALFLTLTRAAWLAFFFLIVLSLFFANIPKRYLLYACAAVVVVVFAAFVLLSANTFEIMLKSRLATDVQSANVSVGSIAFRILLWQSAWELFMRNPFLGIGFDNFVVLNALTPSFPIVRALGGADLYVHNIYLEILAETGLVGFSVFAMLIVTCYRRLVSMFRLMENHQYRFLLLGYGGMLSLWFFMGLSEAALYTPVTAIFFFFILGTISGTNKLLIRDSLTSKSMTQAEGTTHENCN